MDRFILWAVLDMWVGRFGSCHGPFWTYRKFMGRFGRGRFGIDPSVAPFIENDTTQQTWERHD